MNAREWVESTEANEPLPAQTVTRHCALHGPFESVHYSGCPSCRYVHALPEAPHVRR